MNHSVPTFLTYQFLFPWHKNRINLVTRHHSKLNP
jgi:hypothetical protein